MHMNMIVRNAIILENDVAYKDGILDNGLRWEMKCMHFASSKCSSFENQCLNI